MGLDQCPKASLKNWRTTDCSLYRHLDILRSGLTHKTQILAQYQVGLNRSRSQSLIPHWCPGRGMP